MFKQNQDKNQEEVLKKLERIQRTAVDKKEYEQINKTVQFKKIMNRDLKLHTSIWGSHNPSWNAGVNNFLKKKDHYWDENMKNQSNQAAGCSRWDKKYDNNPFRSSYN